MLIGRLSEFIINKYQTAADQFWPTDWQTDTISDWPTADHVRHFAATAFYRAMLCMRGICHGPVSVRLFVRLSVCHKSVFY